MAKQAELKANLAVAKAAVAAATVAAGWTYLGSFLKDRADAEQVGCLA